MTKQIPKSKVAAVKLEIEYHEKLNKPFTIKELSNLLGVHGKTLEYHAVRGRLEKVYGKKRAIGYTAGSVRKLIEGRMA